MRDDKFNSPVLLDRQVKYKYIRREVALGRYTKKRPSEYVFSIKNLHAGEAMYISLIRLRWTSTEIKSIHYDCLHQLWEYICHIGTKMD